MSGVFVQENRVSSRPIRGVERCEGLENTIGWFTFSFCCGMFLGENEGR